MPAGGDRTYRSLQDWMLGQKESERLAAQLLAIEGYKSIDPSLPLGGRDGGKDGLAVRDDVLYAFAVTFSREPVTIRELTKKFVADAAGAVKQDVVGLAFFTNQKLTPAERTELEGSAPKGITLDLYHLERISALLNQPKCYGIRLEFLDIEMSKDEQISFVASFEADRNEELVQALRDQNELLRGLITGGDSYIECLLLAPFDNGHARMELITFVRGEHGLQDVTLRLTHKTPLHEQRKALFELEQFDRDAHAEAERAWTEQVTLGSMRPGQGPTRVVSIPYERPEFKIEVHATARNGEFYTEFTVARDAGGRLRTIGKRVGNHFDHMPPRLYRRKDGGMNAFPAPYDDEE